ncbi:MAG: hypothetical protein DRP45_06600 [Candidatus Zixiibacteriota bacterium]|nr:MAG: hypothetical protein DRP45_06600 [candidate division Zixibacteria bacterium]
MRRALFHSLILVVLLVCQGQCDVVINEVLANEPDGETLLEWFELYNSSGTANLSYYELRVVSGSQDTTFIINASLNEGNYFVIARDSVRFEEHYGDSSGTWNDVPSENYGLRQAGIRLTNTGGSVSIRHIMTGVTSELVWSSSGGDGISWERVEPESDLVGQSTDPSGSTPGRINSGTKLPIDLALEAVEPSLVDPFTRITFRIVNVGTTDISDATLDLYYLDLAEPDSLGFQIGSDPVGAVDTGNTILLMGQYELSGALDSLVAVVALANDDRPADNRMVFTAPGPGFPPIVISEFLANPSGALDAEWVELKNISGEAINLEGWQIGDSEALGTIVSVPLMFQPAAYLVLTDSLIAFEDFYVDFDGVLIEPPTWPTLNNTGDVVRLVDPFGLEIDRFSYDSGFDDNHTWGRGESEDRQDDWGRSEEPGGSPGESNTVRFSDDVEGRLEITIEPRIFSPDGDGLEDATVIKIKSPGSGGKVLKLYDSRGRLVRTFEDGAQDLSEQYVWNGTSDTGARLPIGIYILYFEVAGMDSAKRTIVIAR